MKRSTFIFAGVILVLVPVLVLTARYYLVQTDCICSQAYEVSVCLDMMEDAERGSGRLVGTMMYGLETNYITRDIDVTVTGVFRTYTYGLSLWKGTRGVKLGESSHWARTPRPFHDRSSFQIDDIVVSPFRNNTKNVTVTGNVCTLTITFSPLGGTLNCITTRTPLCELDIRESVNLVRFALNSGFKKTPHVVEKRGRALN